MIAPMSKRFRPSVVLLCLVLTACGGGSSDKTQSDCDKAYWDGTVGFCLAAGWTVIGRDQLREKGIPEDVIVAVKRDQAVSGQFPTLTVTQESLSQPMDPVAYSAAAVQSVTVLPGYKKIDVRKLTVDGADLDLHIFTAQPKPEDPERRFNQVSTTHAQFGYTLTILTPVSPSKDLEKEVTTLLEGLTFVEAAKE